jgi:hypothetical protein
LLTFQTLTGLRARCHAWSLASRCRDGR